MGFIDFTNGEVLTADQMDLVMRQGIMRFADASARDTALAAVLAEGMMAYLDDTDEVLKYDGTNWIDISGDITGVTAGTALTGGGTSGDVTLNVDESALTIAQSQVTNLTTDLAGKQDDVITTQGDLIIGDASGDAVRLPVGAADQVLTSDGTTVSFQDAGGGGGIEQFTLITSGTLTNELLSISSIPQTFDDLLLRLDLDGFIRLRLNNISTENYNATRLDPGGVQSSLNQTSFVAVSRGECRFLGYTADTADFEKHSITVSGMTSFGPEFRIVELDTSNQSALTEISSTLETRTGTFELYGVTYA